MLAQESWWWTSSPSFPHALAHTRSHSTSPSPIERPDFNEILIILDEFLENLQNEKSLDFRRKSSAMLQRNREKKAVEADEENEKYVAYSTQDYSEDKKNPYMSLSSSQKLAPATSTNNNSAMYTEGLEFYTKVEEVT